VLRREQLEQAIGRAESRLLTDAPSLPALVARHRGRRGMATLRAVLADGRIGLDLPRSELELRFQAFLRDRGLPRPEVNVLVDVGARRIEVDCLWRAARLVAELDGHAYHGDSGAFETDRGRDRALVAAGYRCMRITWRALRLEPEAVAADLRASLLGRTRP
jgi:very-short-patch-repair endonuclease